MKSPSITTLFSLLLIVLALVTTATMLAPDERKLDESKTVKPHSARKFVVEPQKLIPSIADPIKSQTNPGIKTMSAKRIPSFRDARVQEEYTYLFSLIGPAAETHGFDKSGYDTEENTQIAYLSLRYRNYEDTSPASFKASLFALEHLARSQLPEARVLRENLRDQYIERMTKSISPVEKSLVSLDLKRILLVKSQTTEELSRFYGTQTEPSVRDAIQYAIIRRLEKENPGETNLNESLARLGVDPLVIDYTSLSPLERKSK